MDELLQTDFAVAEKDRLYRCLGRVLTHKQELFVWLKQKWADLFAADFEVLLYDLTSTYFEGEMEQNPKAKRGYSRDGRADCLQLVIALVVTPDGFPLAYEVMNGNTSDRATLPAFLKKIESTYGKARRLAETWTRCGRMLGIRGCRGQAAVDSKGPIRPVTRNVGVYFKLRAIWAPTVASVVDRASLQAYNCRI